MSTDFGVDSSHRIPFRETKKHTVTEAIEATERPTSRFGYRRRGVTNIADDQ